MLGVFRAITEIKNLKIQKISSKNLDIFFEVFFSFFVSFLFKNCFPELFTMTLKYA